jgi:plasmid stabilization system protein ParE
MMFRLTKLAKQDLRSIGRYTQVTWGKEQRNLYLAKIDVIFHLLAQEPERGKACDDIRSGQVPCGKTLDFLPPVFRRVGNRSYPA